MKTFAPTSGLNQWVVLESAAGAARQAALLGLERKLRELLVGVFRDSCACGVGKELQCSCKPFMFPLEAFELLCFVNELSFGPRVVGLQLGIKDLVLQSDVNLVGSCLVDLKDVWDEIPPGQSNANWYTCITSSNWEVTNVALMPVMLHMSWPRSFVQAQLLSLCLNSYMYVLLMGRGRVFGLIGTVSAKYFSLSTSGMTMTWISTSLAELWNAS